MPFTDATRQSLRSYLLDRGIVSPSSTHEKLVQLAKSDCSMLADQVQAATDAAKTAAADSMSSAMSLASSIHSAAPTQVSSVHSKLARSASTVSSEASSTVSSLAATASKTASQAVHDVSAYLDDTKDYVYSEWNTKQLKDWLKKHGVQLPTEAPSKEQLLELIREPYNKLTYSKPYERLSTEYLRQWLVEHGFLDSQAKKTRREYLDLAKDYYYYVQDSVYDTWQDADLKGWLVSHGFLRSDATKTRDELYALVKDKYNTVSDSLWAGWRDSDMRQYLEREGVRLDAAASRTDLVALMQEHASALSSTASKYISWSDAKLRGFLKDHGVRLEDLPKDRNELLRMMRAYYVPTWSSDWHERAVHFLHRLQSGVRDVFGNSAEQVYRLNADRIGSYVASASASVSSMVHNEL